MIDCEFDLDSRYCCQATFDFVYPLNVEPHALGLLDRMSSGWYKLQFRTQSLSQKSISGLTAVKGILIEAC